MNIKWFGQSSFLISLADGKRIVIDPVGRMLGYKMPKTEADIVAVTHSHRDHNRIEYVSGNYTLVNKPQEYRFDEIWIKGFPTFHDEAGGAKRGDNLMFIFKMEGLTLCHCGDLGHPLSAELAEEIGEVDVLMIPVGGRMTIGAEKASRIKEQLNPSITLPMHYRTKALGLPGMLMFDKADKFIQLAGGTAQHVSKLMVTRENISQFADIITLDYVHRA